MNVQELIDLLNQVKDKSIPVQVELEDSDGFMHQYIFEAYGMSRSSGEEVKFVIEIPDEQARLSRKFSEE